MYATVELGVNSGWHFVGTYILASFHVCSLGEECLSMINAILQSSTYFGQGVPKEVQKKHPKTTEKIFLKVRSLRLCIFSG